MKPVLLLYGHSVYKWIYTYILIIIAYVPFPVFKVFSHTLLDIVP